MVGLGYLPGDNHSSATGVSANGSVVVGFSYLGPNCCNIRAFRWTAAGGIVELPPLPGDQFTSATGVSADGSAAIGFSNSTTTG
jgi:probable HAF family extracellular repeat protein